VATARLFVFTNNKENYMTYRVDQILNGWFGEPPEYSENEEHLIRHLYAPLRKIEDELNRLKQRDIDRSWETNPDRSGGQFTKEEIERSNN
jgi:hypothetical protein